MKKIACVGDSITFGDNILQREKNNYPTQLQQILVNSYKVKNFGKNGATALKNSDLPYWETRMIRKIKKFNPDIIVLALGTNDSKNYYWNSTEHFKADYRQMVELFQQIKSEPKLILCQPPPCFVQGNIFDSTIVHGVHIAISEIAKEKSLTVIDLYCLFEGKENLFPDGIHPNKEGAGLIAETAADAIHFKKK